MRQHRLREQFSPVGGDQFCTAVAHDLVGRLVDFAEGGTKSLLRSASGSTTHSSHLYHLSFLLVEVAKTHERPRAFIRRLYQFFV